MKSKIVVSRLMKLFHRKVTNEILGETRQSLVQQFIFRLCSPTSHFQMFPLRCLCSENTFMVRQVQTQLQRKCILCRFDRVRLSPYCSATSPADQLLKNQAGVKLKQSYLGQGDKTCLVNAPVP